MAKTASDIASVLAFEKKLVPSDGYLYGTNWADRRSKAIPLHLTEKAVRGTISNRLKDAVKNDPMKLNNEVEKANPQRVDACALPMDCDTLKLEYTIKVLGGVERPSACNNASFAEKYRGVAVDSTLLPKVKVEVIISSISVDSVIETAKKALYTGHIGDGKIFVYNVTRIVKVRTGEENELALRDVE